MIKRLLWWLRGQAPPIHTDTGVSLLLHLPNVVILPGDMLAFDVRKPGHERDLFPEYDLDGELPSADEITVGLYRKRWLLPDVWVATGVVEESMKMSGYIHIPDHSSPGKYQVKMRYRRNTVKSSSFEVLPVGPLVSKYSTKNVILSIQAVLSKSRDTISLKVDLDGDASVADIEDHVTLHILSGKTGKSLMDKRRYIVSSGRYNGQFVRLRLPRQPSESFYVEAYYKNTLIYRTRRLFFRGVQKPCDECRSPYCENQQCKESQCALCDRLSCDDCANSAAEKFKCDFCLKRGCLQKCIENKFPGYRQQTYYTPDHVKSELVKYYGGSDSIGPNALSRAVEVGLPAPFISRHMSPSIPWPRSDHAATKNLIQRHLETDPSLLMRLVSHGNTHLASPRVLCWLMKEKADLKSIAALMTIARQRGLEYDIESLRLLLECAYRSKNEPVLIYLVKKQIIRQGRVSLHLSVFSSLFKAAIEHGDVNYISAVVEFCRAALYEVIADAEVAQALVQYGLKELVFEFIEIFDQLDGRERDESKAAVERLLWAATSARPLATFSDEDSNALMDFSSRLTEEILDRFPEMINSPLALAGAAISKNTEYLDMLVRRQVRFDPHLIEIAVATIRDGSILNRVWQLSKADSSVYYELDVPEPPTKRAKT